jgi:6-pyruvoyltetrahydropterin/6-carboxytetrahydropterin synthase
MKVSKMYRFEAAHILPRHPGKCANMHGHSWRVEVEVQGDVNKETGFITDFYDLDRWVEPIIERFDHRLLNCYVRYPSSENVAIHIAHYLRGAMAYHWINVIDDFTVRVSETEKCWAEFNMEKDGQRFDYENVEAEWQSPELVKGGTDVSMVIGNVKAMLPDLQKRYIDALTILEQMKLYVDTLAPVKTEELLK